MTSFRFVYGSDYFADFYASLDATYWNLSSSVSAIGFGVDFPKDGTVDKVGFYVSGKVGTPPSYKVGLVTLDSNGKPTQTAYGGSSIENFSWSSNGWVWVTLGTPATVNAGDFAAVAIWAGTTPPDASNYLRISYIELVTYYRFPALYTKSGASWNFQYAPNPMAIQYTDNTIFGFPASAVSNLRIGRTTGYTECGNKFSFPFDVKCYGARYTNTAADSNVPFSITLYDSSDNILSQNNITDIDNIQAEAQQADLFFDEVQLSANQTYRIAIATTTGYYLEQPSYTFPSLSDKNNSILTMGSEYFTQTVRSGSGSWTDMDTTFLWGLGIWISDITTTGGSEPGGGGSRFGYAG